MNFLFFKIALRHFSQQKEIISFIAVPLSILKGGFESQITRRRGFLFIPARLRRFLFFHRRDKNVAA